jgi:coatomer protein complex subunit alpha (xenin)
LEGPHCESLFACFVFLSDIPRLFLLQVLQVGEKNPKDEMQLNYDPRNPFVVCGSTFTPIYRGSRDVSCPYCRARFVAETVGSMCSICDLAVVGSNGSGLLCSSTQVR